jgi:hypothetical protein
VSLSSQLFAKSSQPGEDGKETYRIEIGRDDGQAPDPYSAIGMCIKVMQDLTMECGIARDDDEAKLIMHRMIDELELKVEKRGIV